MWAETIQRHNNEPTESELWTWVIVLEEGYSRAVYFDAVAAKDCIHPMCPPLLPSLPDQMKKGREPLLSRRPISEADILHKFAAETELEFKGREVTDL